jgi:hypothetical protein
MFTRVDGRYYFLRMNRRRFVQVAGTQAGALALIGTRFALPARAPAKLADVNTGDLRDAIRLGARSIARTFDADDHNRPFFVARALPDPHFGFSETFDVSAAGSKIAGLLNASDALGDRVDDASLDKLAAALFASFAGAVRLPLNRAAKTGALVNFEPANLAECFAGLAALVRFRRSEQAHEIAEQAIIDIHGYWNAERGWNAARLKRESGVNCLEYYRRYDPPGHRPFVSGIGRMLNALALYHEETRSDRAKALLETLREIATAEAFLPAGDYSPERMGTDSSSLQRVMLGVARTAALSGDTTTMKRVQAFFDNGLSEVSNALGWSPELPARANVDTDGVMSAGWTMETALVLGAAGNVGAYQRAESILRARILPTQLRDVSWIPASPASPPSDDTRDVARRIRGSWGMPAPYGPKAKRDPVFGDRVVFPQNVVGDVMTSLAEAVRHVAPRSRDEHRVNLLFDHSDDGINIQSPYAHSEMIISVDRGRTLAVRIPSWTRAEDIRVQGAAEPSEPDGDYLILQPTSTAVSIRFPLMRKRMALGYRGDRLGVRLHGDEVVGMENFGASWTFFDPL